MGGVHLKERMQPIKTAIKQHQRMSDLIISGIATVLLALVMSWTIAWILKPMHIYASGLTGILQLVADVIEMVTGRTVNFGILNLAINIPLIILASKKLSFRFALFSSVAILTSSLFYTFPVVEEVVTVDELTAAIFGGVVVGICTGILFRLGGSGGGLDIFAQYLSLEKGISIANVFYIINGSIIVGVALIHDIDTAILSFVRNGITIVVLGAVHTSYKSLDVKINVKKTDNFAYLISNYMQRGASVIEIQGAYGSQKRQLILMVISTYELRKLQQIVVQLDENAFITATSTKVIAGRFKKKVIQ